ncbi:hypothetical protein LZ575_06190 [Antarcticibacterium sp. 1MA-6-2]|uniref:hypothetical protein n=1 Tax=Antarcticibacterium sp. 1MA-6-2 TaxID=2908210 RepID=UPI001F459FD3|nr:hypothetical protein [Antarcticibacterium sp. 1MA-6-2]UJH92165.1 hypothetical protein LZ575_06190 [Antarcticibacterium sp. 1MA-6-2]
MKSFSPPLKGILFSLSLIIGCTKNNDPGVREEFLTAMIDGQELYINSSNGTLKGEKQITPFGTLNLSVKVLSTNGKSIEFLIENYQGKKLYSIGDRTGSVEGNFTNGHWINYAQTVPPELWSSLFDHYVDGELLNYIEITEDDGNYIKGHFSSENYQET